MTNEELRDGLEEILLDFQYDGINRQECVEKVISYLHQHNDKPCKCERHIHCNICGGAPCADCFGSIAPSPDAFGMRRGPNIEAVYQNKIASLRAQLAAVNGEPHADRCAQSQRLKEQLAGTQAHLTRAIDFIKKAGHLDNCDSLFCAHPDCQRLSVRVGRYDHWAYSRDKMHDFQPGPVAVGMMRWWAYEKRGVTSIDCGVTSIDCGGCDEP